MNSIEITLHSPVCIAQKRGVGNAIETLDYIPGSTIRGALAMRYLKQYGTYNQSQRRWELTDSRRQEEFNQLFLSDEVRFGNAYIGGGLVIPLTAMSCKYDPGFSEDTDDHQETHGVFDGVLPFAKYKLGGELDDRIEVCAECGANMERFRGYYERKMGRDALRALKATKRVIARTAITQTLETALQGSLYTLDVLNENQELRGVVDADASAIHLLQGLIENPSDRLRIGTAKTRALGECGLRFSGPLNQFSVESVRARLDGFNAEVDFTSQTLFTVTLHSDTILLDEILRYKTAIELTDLCEAVAYKTQLDLSILDSFEPLQSWLSIHPVTGWDVAKKRPKTDEIAITKGSVFVWSSKAGRTLTDTDMNSVAALLAEIENTGIGERRNEGFGRIRICDEFHWEVPEK
jgi:CRISPR-associated protein Csx10